MATQNTLIHPACEYFLTRGRFPVAINLARQLWTAGHYLFVVDPMEYHVCKFSKAVKKE